MKITNNKVIELKKLRSYKIFYIHILHFTKCYIRHKFCQRFLELVFDGKRKTKYNIYISQIPETRLHSPFTALYLKGTEKQFHVFFSFLYICRSTLFILSTPKNSIFHVIYFKIPFSIRLRFQGYFTFIYFLYTKWCRCKGIGIYIYLYVNISFC